MVTHWIVDGDTTDHGGIVSVPHSRVDIGGRNVASVGDKVSCPRCNVIATIVEGNPHADIDGASIAEVGNLTSCGARLMSIKQASVGFDQAAAQPIGDANSAVIPVAEGADEICEPCLEEAALRGKGLVDRGWP